MKIPVLTGMRLRMRKENEVRYRWSFGLFRNETDVARGDVHMKVYRCTDGVADRQGWLYTRCISQ